MISRAQVKKATPRRQKKPIFILVLIAIIGIPVWQVWVRKGSKVGAAAQAVEAKTDDQQKRDDALVSALVRDEETHLALMPRMRLLSASIYSSRQLPGAAEEVFAANASVADLGHWSRGRGR